MKRIWIYQADRLLTATEGQEIVTDLEAFAEQWKVHGKPLSASAELRDNLFIILKVDEEIAAASGCSIDSSVRFLKGLESKYGIQLFDRMQFAYKADQGIGVVNRDGFEQLLADGTINDNTLVFDNTITHEHQMEDAWVIPFHKSWHKRLFR